MFRHGLEQIEQLREEWTDQYVEVIHPAPEFQRFAGKVGRVVTVNWSGKALVDFADGAWYDLPADREHLRKLDAAEASSRYDSTVNSAQPLPQRQG